MTQGFEIISIKGGSSCGNLYPVVHQVSHSHPALTLTLFTERML